jgi:hypothetical protein
VTVGGALGGREAASCNTSAGTADSGIPPAGCAVGCAVGGGGVGCAVTGGGGVG